MKMHVCKFCGFEYDTNKFDECLRCQTPAIDHDEEGFAFHYGSDTRETDDSDDEELSYGSRFVAGVSGAIKKELSDWLFDAWSIALLTGIPSGIYIVNNFAFSKPEFTANWETDYRWANVSYIFALLGSAVMLLEILGTKVRPIRISTIALSCFALSFIAVGQAQDWQNRAYFDMYLRFHSIASLNVSYICGVLLCIIYEVRLFLEDKTSIKDGGSRADQSTSARVISDQSSIDSSRLHNLELLERLANLRKGGFLTLEEFEQEKARIFKSPDS